MSSVETFDDIVLGGGKGGKSLAMELGRAGHKVALVERGQIGGTCINVACIPTKTMVASTKLVKMAKDAAHFGVQLPEAQPSLSTIVQRKRRVVQEMVDTHWKLFTTTPNMELIVGTGKFLEGKKIAVTLDDGRERTISAERISSTPAAKPRFQVSPGWKKYII